MGADNLNTRSKGRTKLGITLERSAKEILAHVKGDSVLPTRRIVLPDEVDVKRIRTKARMSQAESARAFALIRERCRNGCGRRKPDVASRSPLSTRDMEITQPSGRTRLEMI